jgi:hypothetical protein
MPEVVIDGRFCGPPGSANGGYAAGTAAVFVDASAVSVRLHAPPPLDVRFEVVDRGDSVALARGGQVIVEARAGTLEADPPQPLSYAAAERAATRYPWLDEHPYEDCFVCGPARRSGDGLRIFCGESNGGDVFAGVWTPDDSVVTDGGLVDPRVEWAVLDCPTGIATIPLVGDDELVLLGTLTAAFEGPARPGEPHVVVARPIGRDGRKLHSVAALFTAAGELVGRSEAVWVIVPPGTVPDTRVVSRQA